jgi:hypothetical protein
MERIHSECIPVEMHPSWVSLNQMWLIQLPWESFNFGSFPQAWKINEHTVSKQCCIFLKECPTMFKECITLVNGKLQNSNATLQLFWNYDCFQWILHRLRELSYWSYAVPFQVTFLQKGRCQSHKGITKVACVMLLFKQRQLAFVHFKYTQLLSKH